MEGAQITSMKGIYKSTLLKLVRVSLSVWTFRASIKLFLFFFLLAHIRIRNYDESCIFI